MRRGHDERGREEDEVDHSVAAGAAEGRRQAPPGSFPRRQPLYAALDLGTNNCRLLVAEPSTDGLRVVDSFSRIVRLGENLSATGRLGRDAMERTLAALSICRDKMASRHVTRGRLIATEACRAAENGPAFIDRVREKVGLSVEIVDRETEASLAAEGCAALADAAARSVLLFDIGGGSTEIVWLAARAQGAAPEDGARGGVRERMRAWTSLPLGVVTLADRFGGVDVSDACFDGMVAHVEETLRPFAETVRGETRCARFHLLGTSGTVTTVAGAFLGLSRYDRRRIDGLWMSAADMDAAIARMRAMPFAERVAHGCIGRDRADLVLAGCAILEAVRRAFPSERLRVADRGLREGMLIGMMREDGHWAPDPMRRGPRCGPR